MRLKTTYDTLSPKQATVTVTMTRLGWAHVALKLVVALIRWVLIAVTLVTITAVWGALTMWQAADLVIIWGSVSAVVAVAQTIHWYRRTNNAPCVGVRLKPTCGTTKTRNT